MEQKAANKKMNELNQAIESQNKLFIYEITHLER